MRHHTDCSRYVLRLYFFVVTRRDLPCLFVSLSRATTNNPRGGGTLGGSLLTPFLCPVSHLSSSSPPWSSLCALSPACTPFARSFLLALAASLENSSLSVSFSLILYAGLNGIVMRRRLQFPPSTLLAIAAITAFSSNSSAYSAPRSSRIRLSLYLSPSPSAAPRSQSPSFSISG